jgi:hypothetical protein
MKKIKITPTISTKQPTTSHLSSLSTQYRKGLTIYDAWNPGFGLGHA